MEKHKPYRCGTCGKRYKNLNGLKYHKNHSPTCDDDGLQLQQQQQQQMGGSRPGSSGSAHVAANLNPDSNMNANIPVATMGIGGATITGFDGVPQTALGVGGATAATAGTGMAL